MRTARIDYFGQRQTTICISALRNSVEGATGINIRPARRPPLSQTGSQHPGFAPVRPDPKRHRMRPPHAGRQGASIPQLSTEPKDRMKIWGAAWKWRKVDNEGKPKAGFPLVPHCLGNRAAISTFPPRHNDSHSLADNRNEQPTQTGPERLLKTSATHRMPSGPFVDHKIQLLVSPLRVEQFSARSRPPPSVFRFSDALHQTRRAPQRRRSNDCRN